MLSPHHRASLSGDAVAIGLVRTSWLYRISVILLMASVGTVAIMLLRGCWNRCRSLRSCGLVFVGLSVLSSILGCDQERWSNRDLASIDQEAKFRFQSAVVDLGEIDISDGSDSPLRIESHLQCLPGVKPTLSGSCGCTSEELGEYDHAGGTWPVTVGIKTKSLGDQRVEVFATSDDGAKKGSLLVRYRGVTGLSAMLEDRTFSRQEGEGLVYGKLIITEKNSRFEPQVELFLTREQAELGITLLSERRSENEFDLWVVSEPADGYQAAFIVLREQNGNKVHPGLPCEWGQSSSLDVSVERFRLRHAGRSSLLISSDTDLAEVASIDCGLSEIQWSTERLQPSTMRLTIEPLHPSRNPIERPTGSLRISLVDGQSLSLPAEWDEK